jgi:hypothetical protein
MADEPKMRKTNPREERSKNERYIPKTVDTPNSQRPPVVPPEGTRGAALGV